MTISLSPIRAVFTAVVLGLTASGCGYNTIPSYEEQFQDAPNQLSGALGRLFAVSENYPDLKSNQNFLALQSQLEGTENRITVARRDYIEAVRAYNLSLRTFPTLLWAKTLFSGNKPMAEFAASEGAEKPPQVKF